MDYFDYHDLNFAFSAVTLENKSMAAYFSGGKCIDTWKSAVHNHLILNCEIIVTRKMLFWGLRPWMLREKDVLEGIWGKKLRCSDG